MGVEMLRCAQHDSAVIHMDVRIIVLKVKIVPYKLLIAGRGYANCASEMGS